MRDLTFGRASKVAVVGAAMLLSMSVAYAAGAEGSPDLAGVTKAGGRSITQVKLVRSTNLNFTSSQTFVAVAGATATVKVPAGSKGLIVARFSAVSNCTDSNGNVIGSYGCELRVLVNGAEAAPASTSVRTAAPAAASANLIGLLSFARSGSGRDRRAPRTALHHDERRCE